MKTILAIREIPDVPDSSLEHVQKHLGGRIRKHPGDGVLGDFVDAKLYSFGDNENGWYVLWHPVDEEVLYFVQYKSVRHAGIKFGRQILVYRQAGAKYRGIVERVFFDYLLPRFKALISDQDQTVWGRRMWVYLADEAFGKGLHVYLMDRRGSGTKTTELKNMPELRAAAPTIWSGTAPRDRMTLLVISRDPL